MATTLGAAGGAAIGYGIKGKDGALIGAAAGAAAAALGQKAVGTWYNDQIAEAREQGARDERIKVMNEYWKSNAVDKAHERPVSSSDKNSKTATMVYPPGVYDGVLYGPRTEEVPVAN